MERKTRLLMRLITLFLLASIFNVIVYAQKYPRWFLSQGSLKCESSVGYAVTGYYSDSSLVAAFNNSSINMAVNAFYTVKGGQGFWTTEIGSIWMGKDIKVAYDTAMTNYYSNILVTKDSYTNNKIQIVLALEKDCDLTDYEKGLVKLNNSSVPDWIEALPKSKDYYFAVGEAPIYFYESSSWLEAEENARINLAKQVGIQVQSMEKFTKTEGQSISKEELSLSLSGVRIVERWFNINKKIFYVLVKMSKI